MLQALNNQEIRQRLANLNGWTLDAQHARIQKEMAFVSFKTAMRFIAQLGELAEANNHHPEFISNYTKLKISLTTHDVQALTDQDFELANQIDQLIGRAFLDLLKE